MWINCRDSQFEQYMAARKPTRKTQNDAPGKTPGSKTVSGKRNTSSVETDNDVEAEIIEPEKDETKTSSNASGNVPPFIDMPTHTPRKSIMRRLFSTLLLVIITSALSLVLTFGVLFQTGIFNPQDKTQLETLENNLQTKTDDLLALQKEINQLKARNEAALALFSEFNEKLTGLEDTENLETRLAGMDELISALEERSDENRSLLLSDAKKLETLSRSVGALREKTVTVLPQAFSTSESQNLANLLAQAIIRGGPFEAELKAVEAEGQLSASLDWVRPYAREGIHSLERLTEKFQDRISELLRNAPSGENDEIMSEGWAKRWFEGLMDGLGDWIRIRRTDYPDIQEIGGDAGPAYSLAQIEKALLNDQATEALKLSRQLPADIQSDLKIWMEDLQGYVESRRLLVVLSELDYPSKDKESAE
ncbi:MAG: hypothetical protein CBE09_01725 [Rhizobiales bacterium TMED249]|nr:MAG: hypothetical protein CBE09_01725 [Rhizobiales bacterium TMED249]